MNQITEKLKSLSDYELVHLIKDVVAERQIKRILENFFPYPEDTSQEERILVELYFRLEDL